jgi:hypothetical protein
MKIKPIQGILILLLISATNAFAQPGGDQYCPDGVTPYTPDGCPLDTWVIFLVIVASVFAAKKLYCRNRVPS